MSLKSSLQLTLKITSFLSFMRKTHKTNISDTLRPYPTFEDFATQLIGSGKGIFGIHRVSIYDGENENILVYMDQRTMTEAGFDRRLVVAGFHRPPESWLKRIVSNGNVEIIPEDKREWIKARLSYEDKKVPIPASSITFWN